MELIVEPTVFTIERVDNGEIKNGREAQVEIKMQNNTETLQPSTFIVALYDNDTDQMINYSFVKDIFEPERSRNLGAGFIIPDKGKFIIKCFVWDCFWNYIIFYISRYYKTFFCFIDLG